MTLEKDDIELARTLLCDQSRWFDDLLVTQYQSEFSHWNDSAYAFAFMGGRIALSACIYALGLKPGDEVIIPGYTCVVVPNSFAYAGVDVVCADIELDTYGLDIDAVARAVTSKTRAVMLHHLYGLVCRDYEPLIEFCRRRGLLIIEDCAHSTGAEWRGRKIGNLGHVGFYSSEQSKIFNTVQGGMAVTNDPEIARRLERFASDAPLPDEAWINRQLKTDLYNYYKYKHSQCWFTGEIAELLYSRDILISTTAEEERCVKPAHYGRRMPGAIALLGLKQLGKIDRFNTLRRQTAKRWDKWCEHRGFCKPFVSANSTPVFLRYPVMVTPEMKKDLRWGVEELGMRPGVWFTSNYHPVPVSVPNCPNSDMAVLQCINLPTIIG